MMASFGWKYGLSIIVLFAAISGIFLFILQENGCLAVKLGDCTSGSCQGTGIIYVPCTSANCPAIWSEWVVQKAKTNESICTQTRQRNCTNIDNVPNCHKYQTESIICKTSLWSSWGDWKCSQSDSACTARRERKCYIGIDNTPCNGTSNEDGQCTTLRCQGQTVLFWSEWSDHKCFFEKNGCFHIRNRTCSNGINHDCEGKHYHISALCSKNCYGKWSDWSGWHCKKGGGAYTAERSRNCLAQAPVTCQGSSNELYSCGPSPCPVCNEFAASNVTPGQNTVSYWTAWRCFNSNNIVYRIRYDSGCSGSDCQEKDNHEIDWCNVAKCPDCYNGSTPIANPTEQPNSNQVTDEVSTNNPWDHWRCVNDTDTGLMFRVEHKDCDTIDCKSEIHAMEPCNETTCPECFPNTDTENVGCYDVFGTTCSSLGLQQDICNDPDFSSNCRKTCKLCESPTPATIDKQPTDYYTAASMSSTSTTSTKLTSSESTISEATTHVFNGSRFSTYLSVFTVTTVASTDTPDSLKNATSVPTITIPDSGPTSTYILKNITNPTTVAVSGTSNTTTQSTSSGIETVESTSKVTSDQSYTSSLTHIATASTSQLNVSQTTDYTTGTDNCLDDPETACGAFNRFLCDDPKLSYQLCKKTCNLCDSTSTPSISPTINAGKTTPQNITTSKSPSYWSTNTLIDADLTTQSFAKTTYSVKSSTGLKSVTDSLTHLSSTTGDATGSDLCFDEYDSTCTSFGFTQSICQDPSIATFCRKSCGLCGNSSSAPFPTEVTPTRILWSEPDLSTTNPDNLSNKNVTTAFHTTSSPEMNSTKDSLPPVLNTIPSKITTAVDATNVTSYPNPSSITTSSNHKTTLPVVFTSVVGATQINKTIIKTTSEPYSTTKLTTQIATTTAKTGHTIAPTPTRCAVCVGPPEFCDELYDIQTCSAPDNYCINHVKNYDDGSRIIERGCGNHTRCYREWFQGSSDNDKCQNFVEDNVITLEFECTYCCIKDECNVKVYPALDTLYKDV